MSIVNKKRRMKRTWNDIIYDLICNACVIFVTVVVIYPIYFILVASVSDPIQVNLGTPLLFPKGFSLEGYIEVFRNDEVWMGYANTILYTVTSTLLEVCIILLAGYALSRRDLPGRGIVMMYFVFTMYFGGGLIPTYAVIKSLGLLNTRMVLIILGCCSVYNIIVIRSFMIGNIPEELREASLLDGCGNGYFFTRIVLPLSKAIIAVMVLYTAVGVWNSYFPAMIYTTDKTLYPLQLILRKVLLIAQASATDMDADPELMAEMVALVQVIKYAFIVVATLPIICVYPFVQKYFVKGVMIGSIKG